MSERVLFGRPVDRDQSVRERGRPEVGQSDVRTICRVPAGAASAAVRVAPNGLLSDCLCYGADRLQHRGPGFGWRRPARRLGVIGCADPRDPNGQPLPNLKAMGADPCRKDLFIEIGYMKTDAPTVLRRRAQAGALPSARPAALKLMGDAFAKRPGRSAVHFDVGSGVSPAGEARALRHPRAGLARGGEAIDEMATVCTPGATDQPWVCQFSELSRHRRLEVRLPVPEGPGAQRGADAPVTSRRRSRLL
ncbi:MAG: hypothetical protein MZV70_42565 [Desulfobacterales bacterium]|nr:hypothetical protein [Desulfobacterales bacterium]